MFAVIKTTTTQDPVYSRVNPGQSITTPADNPPVGSILYDIKNNLPLGSSSSQSQPPVPSQPAPTAINSVPTTTTPTPAESTLTTLSRGSTNDNSALRTLMGDYVSRLTLPKEPNEQTIREEARVRAQTIADQIRTQYAPQFKAQEENATARNARTAALNRSQGLMGSNVASSNAQKTEDINAKDRKMLEDQMQSEITSVLLKMDDRATQDYKERRDQYLKEVEGNYGKVKEFYETQQKTAMANAAMLATSGIDITKLKERAPDTYKQLLEESGYSEGIFDIMYNQSLPENLKRNYEYKTVGNKLYAISYNPASKKIETQEITTPGGSFDQFMITPDGTPVFVDKTNGRIQIAGGFKEGQFAKNPTPKNTPTSNQDEITTSLDTAKAYIEAGEVGYDQARQRFLNTFGPKAASQWEAYMKGIRK